MVISFSIRNILMLLLIGIAIYICYQAKTIIIIALFSILLAYMVNPILAKLARIRVPRYVSTTLVFFIIIFLLILAISWLTPEIYRDIELLINSMPAYVDFIDNILEKIGERIGMDLSKNTLYAQVFKWIKSSGMIIVGWLGGIAGSIRKVFEITINVVMVPVIAFMLLVDADKVNIFIDRYIGVTTPARTYLQLFSRIISSYFRGQITVALILAVLYTIALKIIGLEVAVLMGIFTGLLSIVPFLGFTIGIVLSVLTAAIQFQDILHPLYVIIGYGIIQVLETTIITPRIVGESVGIHPVVTIIVLLVGGSVFGLLGMIFAVPIVAVIFNIYKMHFNEYIYDNAKVYPSNILNEDEKESLKNIMDDEK